MPGYTAEQTDANVLTIRMVVDKMGWDQWFLCRSDAHHDNPKCRRDLEIQHLKEAKERGAGVLDIGDLFCAMQGKADRRSDKAHLDPKYCDGDYFDAIINEADDFYAPYAGLFELLAPGNHEKAVKNHHETNLTKRLARRLELKSGKPVAVGGYSGWVQFLFKHNGTHTWRQNLWYTHGYGGGGPVTEDMIQSNRQRVYVDGADIMMSGHVHRSWTQEYVKLRLTQYGKVERREGIYVKLPTYKDAYGTGEEGFESERGPGPRPVGAYWIRFSYRHRKRITTDIIKAH